MWNCKKQTHSITLNINIIVLSLNKCQTASWDHFTDCFIALFHRSVSSLCFIVYHWKTLECWEMYRSKVSDVDQSNHPIPHQYTQWEQSLTQWDSWFSLWLYLTSNYIRGFFFFFFFFFFDCIKGWPNEKWRCVYIDTFYKDYRS